MDIEQMKKDLGGGNVFPIGEENVAFAKYFTGECYLNMLTTERVPVGLVTFAPGTINAYHIHHKGGQILLVTGGRGWYQEEGKPARELKAGDVVNISPEVKHWHGAAVSRCPVPVFYFWRCSKYFTRSKTLARGSERQLVPASGC